MKRNIEVVAQVLGISQERAIILFENGLVIKNRHKPNMFHYAQPLDKYEVSNGNGEIVCEFNISKDEEIVNISKNEHFKLSDFMPYTRLTSTESGKLRIRDYIVELPFTVESLVDGMVRNGMVEESDRHKQMFDMLRSSIEHLNKYEDWNQEMPKVDSGGGIPPILPD